MSGFKKFFDNLFFKGGILAAGASFMFLCRKNIYPEFTGPLFYTFTTVGFMAVLSHILRQKDDPYTYKKLPISMDFASDTSSEDSVTYNARMAEFQAVKPKLLRTIREQKELFEEAQRLIEGRDRLEEWLEDSQRIGERMQAQHAEREAEPEAEREAEPEAAEPEAEREAEPEAAEPEVEREAEPEVEREAEPEVEMATEAVEEFKMSE